MRMPSMGKPLGLSLLVLVLSLAGAEGGFRAWLWFRGEPFEPGVQRRALEAAREAALGLYSGEFEAPGGGTRQRETRTHVIHPYFAFDKPNGVRQLERDLARAGRAGPERHVVVILGGSVAAGFVFLGGRGSRRSSRRTRASRDATSRCSGTAWPPSSSPNSS